MTEKRAFFSFGFKVFVYLLAAFLVSNALLYYTTNYSLGGSYYETLVVLNVARHATIMYTVTVNALLHLTALGLVFMAALVMSHNISGPLYRLEKTARALEEGDLTVTTSLRNSDYIRPQAEELNNAVANMCEKLAAVESGAASLKQKTASIEAIASVSMRQGGEILTLIAEMQAETGKVKDALSFFKTRESK